MKGPIIVAILNYVLLCMIPRGIYCSIDTPALPSFRQSYQKNNANSKIKETDANEQGRDQYIITSQHHISYRIC